MTDEASRARTRPLALRAAPRRAAAAALAALMLLGGLAACEGLPEPRDDWHMWDDRSPMPRGA